MEIIEYYICRHNMSTLAVRIRACFNGILDHLESLMTHDYANTGVSDRSHLDTSGSVKISSAF